MCQTVKTRTVFIETVGQLKEQFPGVELIRNDCYDDFRDDDCLCVLELEDMFDKANINYTVDVMDYTIT
jgi:hypothetical protein